MLLWGARLRLVIGGCWLHISSFIFISGVTDFCDWRLSVAASQGAQICCAIDRWPSCDSTRRCRRTTGAATRGTGRMTRSLVAGWGAAATWKPWGTRRAGTRTPAPRRRLRSRCGQTLWLRVSSDPETCWTHRGTTTVATTMKTVTVTASL